MFAETLRSQESSLMPIKTNILRATQTSFEFKPTLSSSSFVNEKPYLVSSSSLLLSLDPRQPSTSDAHVFKNPNEVLPDKFHMFGRRFQRNKLRVSSHFQDVEVKKKIAAEKLRKDRVKQRERNVTVYRKYRIGDFPDIEISLGAIVTTLQVLTRVGNI